MKTLEDLDERLYDKVRSNNILSHIYHAARFEGITEHEMLLRTVSVLINLQDEVFQQKVDELMNSPQPLITENYLNNSGYVVGKEPSGEDSIKMDNGLYLNKINENK